MAKQKNNSYSVGRKKENIIGEKKRKKRYNQRVWKGWDRQEPPGKVTTYHISELGKADSN